MFTARISRKPHEELALVAERKSSGKSSGKKQKSSGTILELLRADNTISIPELAAKIGISERAIEKQLANLRDTGALRRVGPAKGGKWEVLD